MIGRQIAQHLARLLVVLDQGLPNVDNISVIRNAGRDFLLSAHSNSLDQLLDVALNLEYPALIVTLLQSLLAYLEIKV